MDEKAYRAKLRHFRGTLGLILAGVWIVYWWKTFDAQKAAQLSACGVDEAGCEVLHSSTFGLKIFLVIVVAPLAFWIAHHLAKLLVDRDVADERRQHEEREQARLEQREQTLSQIGQEASQEASQARDENARHELITRLGAVDDQLIVLEGERDPERVTRIKLSIAQALREIDAKFTDDELQALQTAHRAIRQRVERTRQMMRELGLEGTRLYADISGMFGFEGTTESNRALNSRDETEEPSPV